MKRITVWSDRREGDIKGPHHLCSEDNREGCEMQKCGRYRCAEEFPDSTKESYQKCRPYLMILTPTRKRK